MLDIAVFAISMDSWYFYCFILNSPMISAILPKILALIKAPDIIANAVYLI